MLEYSTQAIVHKTYYNTSRLGDIVWHKSLHSPRFLFSFFFPLLSSPFSLQPFRPCFYSSKLSLTTLSYAPCVSHAGLEAEKKGKKKFLLQHVYCSVVCILYLPYRFCRLGCYTTYAGNLIHGEGFCLFLPRGSNFVFFLQLAGVVTYFFGVVRAGIVNVWVTHAESRRSTPRLHPVLWICFACTSTTRIYDVE